VATKNPAKEENVKLWRLPELGGVELMHATYVTQAFPRHSHEGFAVGAIERGALGFFYRGENVVAPAGAVNLANPGEAHTGHAATGAGWTYRMFYFDAELLRKAACEMSGRPRDIPFFKMGVIHDDCLSRVVRSLHSNLEQGGISRLERESRFLWMLAQLIAGHADAPPPLHTVARERRRVRLVREAIDAHYSENVSLARLAFIAGLSPFHLVRVFRHETGLPPHAYQTQVRINRARTFLRKGWPIAAVAFEVGFADQSHFTRHFKRITGVTPGQYSKIVQDM
jgi:AraC-like DNA-binding protein